MVTQCNATQLLDALLLRGFSKASIAKLAGTNIPTLHRWKTTGFNNATEAVGLLNAVSMVAYLETSPSLINRDVVEWLEAPIEGDRSVFFLNRVYALTSGVPLNVLCDTDTAILDWMFPEPEEDLCGCDDTQYCDICVATNL